MAEPFVGEIRIFAGAYVPEGWYPCDGRLLSITDNQVLFALLGTIYGGDGRVNFAIPNLGNRIPIGQGGGPGLTNRTMGQSLGREQVTLTTSQLPAHQHALMASGNKATQAAPGAGMLLGTTDSAKTFYAGVPADANNIKPMGPYVMPAVATGNTPHENRMPTITLQYMIAAQGLYPSQS